jgi:hypothetical protein
MNSYADAGIAHAELLLVTCFEMEDPQGNKTSSLHGIFGKVPCSLHDLKTMPKSVLCWREGDDRAIELVPGPPKLSQDPSLHHPSGGFS